MNNILVILAAAIAVTWFIAERQGNDEEEIEADSWIEEREDHIADSVRACSRKHKRIDFIIGE